MVVRYWTPAAGPAQDLADALHARLSGAANRPVAAEALRRELESRDFHALIFSGTRDDLDTHLARGRPLIVCVRQGKRLHYLVARGIEEGGVWLNDPAEGRARRAAWDEFAKQWKGADYWTLLAVPRSAR